MNDFKLKQKIGKGSFGDIWLAKNIIDNNLYAIKIYKKDFEDDKKRNENFENSLKISKKLKHPNLMKCHDFFYEKIENNKLTGKSTIKLVAILEYVEGKELSKMNSNMEIYLPQIVSALKYLHKNKIIHRDIKPENILVTEDNKIKIIDYDFLKILKNKIKTKVGTPYYLSPEIQSGKEYDHKTDLWSLGVTLYKCLSGKFPFNGENKEELKKIVLSNYEPDYSKIPIKFREIVKNLLIRDPEKRITLNEILKK